MKTLREYIDQLDEISRRDFLKGAGATAGLAAIGAPKDAKADWEKPFVNIDQMTGKTHVFWTNNSVDNTAKLMLVKKGNDFVLPELILQQGTFERRAPYGTSEIWVDVDDNQIMRTDQNYIPGRMRIDNGQVFSIRFAFPYKQNNVAILLSGTRGQDLGLVVANAKEKILIDTQSVSNRGVIQFNVQQVREDEELDEASDDAVARILALSKK